MAANLVGSSSFGDLDVTSKDEQSDWRNRSGQREDQPQASRVTFAMLRAERRKEPSTCSDQEFADQKRKVSERAVGSLLTRRCDRRRVFIDARRIESFAYGKDRQVDRRHDVVRMNRARELQINVAERVSERAVCRRAKPIRRQNHAENSHPA